MRLASVISEGREQLVFEFDEARLVPVATAAQAAGPAHAALAQVLRIETLLAGEESLLWALGRLVEHARAHPRHVPMIEAATVRWLPPVPRPGKIVGIPLNNRGADDRMLGAPDHPLFFLKPASCLIGHREPLVLRAHFGAVHPEPELAVVIGRRARDVDPRQALAHVFGFSILNDFTGVDMRAEDRVHYHALYPSTQDPEKLEKREQHNSYTARYKGADGFGPFGPWLVTRDDVRDPGALDVRCSVGGETIAEDSTAFYRYRVEEVVAWVSRFQTLWPGDVISMGTAFRAGAGAKRTLHLADLQRVDGPVEVSITGLGTLTTPVVRDATPLPDWRLPG